MHDVFPLNVLLLPSPCDNVELFLEWICLIFLHCRTFCQNRSAVDADGYAADDRRETTLFQNRYEQEQTKSASNPFTHFGAAWG